MKADGTSDATLNFERIGGVEDKGLTSLRYSPVREGLLGLLSNQGGLRVFQLSKMLGGDNAEMLRDHYRDDNVRIGGAESGMVDKSPDMLFLKRTVDGMNIFESSHSESFH